MIINDFIMLINNVHDEKIVLKQSRIFLSSVYDSLCVPYIPDQIVTECLARTSLFFLDDMEVTSLSGSVLSIRPPTISILGLFTAFLSPCFKSPVLYFLFSLVCPL